MLFRSKLAHAYGIPATRVTLREEVMPALQKAHHHDGPYLIEFVVDPSVHVYPLVPPGGSLAETREDPQTTPAR